MIGRLAGEDVIPNTRLKPPRLLLVSLMTAVFWTHTGPAMLATYGLFRLWSAQFHVLATPFEMALPIPGKKLWAARTGWLAAEVLLFVGLTVGFACVVGTPKWQLFHDGVLIAAALLLALAILRSGFFVRNKMSWPWRLGLTAVVLGEMVQVIRHASGFPIAYAAGLTLIAAAVFWWTYRRIPMTCVLAPDKPTSGMVSAPDLAEVRSRSVPVPVFRALYNWPLVWFCAVPAMLAIGIFLMGPAWALWLLFTAAWLPMGPAIILQQRLKLLVALPLSRSSMFHWAMIPSVALWSAGIALGWKLQGLGWKPRFDLHVDVQTAAALVVLSEVIWLVGQLQIILSLRTPHASLGNRLFRRAVSAVNRLWFVILFGGLGWLGLPRTSIFPEAHAAVRTSLLDGFRAFVSLFPSDAAAALVLAGAILVSVYLLAWRVFAKSEWEPMA